MLDMFRVLYTSYRISIYSTVSLMVELSSRGTNDLVGAFVWPSKTGDWVWDHQLSHAPLLRLLNRHIRATASYHEVSRGSEQGLAWSWYGVESVISFQEQDAHATLTWCRFQYMIGRHINLFFARNSIRNGCRLQHVWLNSNFLRGLSCFLILNWV